MNRRQNAFLVAAIAAGERSLLELAGILDDEAADALREAVDEPVLTRNAADFERLGVEIQTY